MATLLCFVYFIVLTVIGFYLVYKPYGVISAPFDRSLKMRCKGTELLLIFMFTTGLIGLIPVLSIRLAVLEVLCIIGIYKSHSSPIFSFPIILFFIFLLWEIWGLSYTPSPEFGFRMILKYIYPLLLALFASSVVRDKEIVLKSLLGARWVAVIAVIFLAIPVLTYNVFGGVFWHQAAIGTHCIFMCIFSLSMLFFVKSKKKNFFFFLLFLLPCFYFVLRTDILGTMIALSSFVLIKYKVKAIPVILLLGILSIAALFYIPSIKSKMYFHPDEVSLNDFLTGNVDENNINTSGRKAVWEDCKEWFYKGNELVGSGTGRVQTYMYTEATGWRRGGQIHNDILVLLCDNGIIGLSLYMLSVLSIFIHCLILYNSSKYTLVLKMCAIISGSSLLGIVATMYSDNTLSYSMATLSYPWGLYGMVLGLKYKEDSK